MNKPANDDSISRVFPKKTNLFSKRLSEARAAIERSRPDFVKAIFFQREANPPKHRQLFFQIFQEGPSLVEYALFGIRIPRSIAEFLKQVASEDSPPRKLCRQPVPGGS